MIAVIFAASACWAAAPGIANKSVSVVRPSVGPAYRSMVVRANEFTTGAQENVTLDIGPGGVIAIGWESRRERAGQPGVFARLFDLDGRPITDPLGLRSTQPAQNKPTVLALNSRPILFGEAPFEDRSLGAVVGPDGLLNATTKGDQGDVVACRTRGGALAAWSSQTDRRERRIVARPLGSDGRLAGPESSATSDKAVVDLNPAIASDGERVGLVWQRFDPTGKPSGIFGRPLAGNGSPVGPIVRIVGPSGVEPTLAASSGGYVLAWNDLGKNGLYTVRALRLDAALRPLGRPMLVADGGVSLNGASVAGRADGQFIMAWNLIEGERRAIWLRRYARNGKALGPSWRLTESGLNGSLAEGSGHRRLDYASDGSITVAWNGDGALGDDTGAYFTRLTPLRPGETVLASREPAAPRGGSKPTLEPKAQGPRIAAVREQAGPIEPPTYNPLDRQDPWGSVRQFQAGGFTAIANTGWTPPDPHSAVGRDYIVAMTNGAIAFFKKDGTKTFQQPIENTGGFWGSLGATNFVFDPEAVYDPLTDRFLVLCAERGSDGRSYFLLAASDDGDPNGTWYKYRIDVTTLGGGGDIDSDNLAIDSQAVYLTADFFTGGQKYLGYILRKSDVLAGVSNPLTRNFLVTGSQSFGIPQTLDTDSPAQYMIEHFEASNNTTVRLYAITDPLGTPQRTTFTLPVPAYSPPGNIPSGGTSTQVTAFDARFWSTVYRNGSLWATHHVNNPRTRARWYEIKMNGWPTSGQNPTLAQSGEIDLGGTIRTSFSSISVNEKGDAAVVSARSSPTEMFSVYVAWRSASDPPGTMPNQEIAKSSAGAYGNSRWGDYSGANVDPMTGSFWGHHEYNESSSWLTWLQPFGPNRQDALPESLSVFRGGQESGSLSSLFSIDQNYLVVRNGPVALPSEAPITVIVTGTAGVDLVQALKFSITDRVSIANLAQTVSLFDFGANDYEIVGMNAAPTVDTTFDFSPPNPGRFVKAGTNEMRAKLEVRPSGALFTNQWRVFVDAAGWRLN